MVQRRFVHFSLLLELVEELEKAAGAEAQFLASQPSPLLGPGFWSFGAQLQKRFWSKGVGFGVRPSLLVFVRVGGFGVVLECLPFVIESGFLHFGLLFQALEEGEKRAVEDAQFLVGQTAPLAGFQA